MATLVALTDGPDLIVDKPVMLLGRHAECDVQLHSGKVSRRHCVIAVVNEALVIRDLGSTNGVRINGERKIEGVLNDGDEVAIGNFCYRVRTGPPSSLMPPPRLPAPRAEEDARLENADEPVALSDARESQILLARKAPKK